MPEGDGGCSASGNSVVFGDWAAATEHALEVVVKPFVLPAVVNSQVDFIVDLPAPAVIVHGAHVDETTVCQVDLGVQQALLSLEDVDALEDEPLEEHVIEDVAKDRLVTLSRSEDACGDSPVSCFPHGSVELNHRVVVRLDDLDLLLRPLHHLQHALLDLEALRQRVVVQQLVLPSSIKLRIGIQLAQSAQQRLVLVLCVQAIAVLIGSVCEMLSILVQCDVLSEVVEILVLKSAVANACVATLNVSRPDQSVIVRNDQLLVMPAPHVLVEIAPEGLQSPLWIQQQESTPTVLKADDELLLGPVLDVVNEKHHVYASLAGLDELEEGRVCCRR